MDHDITEILQAFASKDSGDRASTWRAMDQLIPLVYAKMRLIAGAARRGEPPAAPQPTELVHEAYLKMIGNHAIAWQSRSHFYAACAVVIRRLLVDAARSRATRRRGGHWIRLGDSAYQIVSEGRSVDLIDLDDALRELERLSPRQSRLIELRYFGGLSESETAEVLSVSRRTVSGDWAMAKAWLNHRLNPPDAETPK